MDATEQIRVLSEKIMKMLEQECEKNPISDQVLYISVEYVRHQLESALGKQRVEEINKSYMYVDWKKSGVA